MRGRTDHRVRGSQLRLSYAFVTVRIIIVKYVVVHKNEKTPKVVAVRLRLARCLEVLRTLNAPARPRGADTAHGQIGQTPRHNVVNVPPEPGRS